MFNTTNENRALVSELMNLLEDTDPRDFSDTWRDVKDAGERVVTLSGTNDERNAELARAARHAAETDSDPTVAAAARRVVEIAEGFKNTPR